MRLLWLNKALCAVFLVCCAANAQAQGVKNFRALDVPPPQPLAAGEVTLVENAPEAVTVPENGHVLSLPVEEPAANEEIYAEPLANVSLDTIGLYDAKGGGLADTLWQGTTVKELRPLFADLPETVASPVLRDLLVRALLTIAKPPAAENIQQHVFHEKLHALLQLDAPAQALRMIELVPQGARTEDLELTQVDALLLQGEVVKACALAEKGIGKAGAALRQWQELMLFCYAYRNEGALASMMLDALSEQNVEVNGDFVHLIRAKALGDGVVRFTEQPSLSHAAMIALLRVDAFPEGYIYDSPLPIARLIRKNAGEMKGWKEGGQARLVTLQSPDVPQRKSEVTEWLRGQFAADKSQIYDYDQAVKALKNLLPNKDENVQAAYARRFYVLLQALGFNEILVVDAGTNGEAKGITLAPALRRQIQEAAEQGAAGKAVLLIAGAAGEQGQLAALSDYDAAFLVDVLLQLHLNKEAEYLAAEALGNGQ